jgi:uncharacterized membrane protein
MKAPLDSMSFKPCCLRTLRAPLLVLGLFYVCFLGCLAASNTQLPGRVATHFDASGQPNGWMSRTAHLRLMIAFGLGFPLFVPALVYIT